MGTVLINQPPLVGTTLINQPQPMGTEFINQPPPMETVLINHPPPMGTEFINKPPPMGTVLIHQPSTREHSSSINHLCGKQFTSIDHHQWKQVNKSTNENMAHPQISKPPVRKRNEHLFSSTVKRNSAQQSTVKRNNCNRPTTN
jgi:hypothetical protein